MNHHRQTACFLLTACFLTVGAVAQTPQRTDIGSLLDPMPKLPATTQDALTMPANDRYLPYADQMNDLLEKTKQSNPTTVRVQKQAVATDTKIKSGVSWLLTNPAEDQRIRLNALQQRQRTGNATLATATAEWAKRQAALKKLIADYQVAMTTIQYGESLFSDDTLFQNAATLTGQQSMVFSMLRDIDQTLGKIAGQAAITQNLVVDESKMTIGPRQFMAATGGQSVFNRRAADCNRLRRNFTGCYSFVQKRGMNSNQYHCVFLV